jgi:hypothetical protein
MTNRPKDIDELRADFVARQNSLLPVDPSRYRIDTYSLFWTDRDGMPWGRLALAVFFLLLTAGLVAIPILRDFEDGTLVAWILALGPGFFSWRLFGSIFRRFAQSGRGPKEPRDELK